MRIGLGLVLAVVAVGLASLSAVLRPSFPVHTHGGILVTGCNSGLGRATAMELASMGYLVFATVRKPEQMQSLIDEFNRQQASTDLGGEATSGGNLFPLVMDVGVVESRTQGFETIQAELNRLDQPLIGLVNNAAVAATESTVDITFERLLFDFNVNVFSPIMLAQQALQLLPPGGRIVNIGSLMGRVAFPTSLPYGTTKWAMRGLSDTMRLDLGDPPYNVAVSLIEPGFFFSHMCDDEEFCKSSPRDTVEAIVHAITSPSPQPKYVTAEVLGLPAWVIAPAALLPDTVKDWLIKSLHPNMQ